jgi:hypothetical protein
MSPVRPLLATELATASRERLLEGLEDSATVSATMVLDAIARREAERQTATIVRLTWAITVMTVVVAVATVVNVAVLIVRG